MHESKLHSLFLCYMLPSSGVNLVRSLGGRESGRQNFRFQPRNLKFSIFRKNLRFSWPKILKTFFHIFTFYTCIFNSLSLKNDEKLRFLTYFLCKIGYSVFRDPFTPPLRPPNAPTTPQPKIWGGRPPTPRID